MTSLKIASQLLCTNELLGCKVLLEYMKNKIHTELEKIFFDHYEEWCMVAYTYLKNKEESEEVVQDVCVKVLLRDSGSEIFNLKAYILTAVKNNSLQKVKHLRKFTKLSETETFASPSCEEKIISLEKKLSLQKAIASLPEPSKKVFNLCVVEGEKYQNVADTLGISVNTVKYHIKKSYKLLRNRVQQLQYLVLIFVNFIG